MTLDSRIDSYRTDAHAVVELDFTRGHSALLAIEEGDLPTLVKSRLAPQIADMLEQVQLTGELSPTAVFTTPLSQLTAGESSNTPTTLPGGSARTNNDDVVLTGTAAAMFRSLLQGYSGSADQLVENFHNILGALSGVSPTQVAARSTVIAKVADGTIAVKDSGNLKLKEDFDTQSTALSDEKAKVQTWSSRFGSLERKLRTGSPDDAVYDQRLLGLHDLASLLSSPRHGGLLVAPDGHVSLPAVTPRPSGSAELDAATRLLKLFKSHARPVLPTRLVPMTIRLKIADLGDEDKATWEAVPTT